jgi:hypothetical protein
MPVCLERNSNAWQYWRRPDRIVVDRSNGRVLVINDRQFGETEVVKMRPDQPGNAVTPVYAQPKQHKQNFAPEKSEKTVAAAPVAVVNNPSPEYRSGEVSVAVRENENPIIRLGLAPNGVTLVEFPASDNFFAINPGNTDSTGQSSHLVRLHTIRPLSLSC